MALCSVRLQHKSVMLLTVLSLQEVLLGVKQSKDGILKQVVPGIHKLRSKYELFVGSTIATSYLKIMAILQKYIDQGISVNTSYNPQYFDEKIPMSLMIQHLLMF